MMGLPVSAKGMGCSEGARTGTAAIHRDPERLLRAYFCEVVLDRQPQELHDALHLHRRGKFCFTTLDRHVWSNDEWHTRHPTSSSCADTKKRAQDRAPQHLCQWSVACPDHAGVLCSTVQDVYSGHTHLGASANMLSYLCPVLPIHLHAFQQEKGLLIAPVLRTLLHGIALLDFRWLLHWAGHITLRLPL